MAYINLGTNSIAPALMQEQTAYYRQGTAQAQQNRAALQRQTLGAFSGGFGQGMQLGSNAVQAALNRKFQREQTQTQFRNQMLMMDREEQMAWDRIGWPFGFRKGDQLIQHFTNAGFETLPDWMSSEDAKQRLRTNGLLFAQQMQQRQVEQARQRQEQQDQAGYAIATPQERKAWDGLVQREMELHEPNGRFHESEIPQFQQSIDRGKNNIRQIWQRKLQAQQPPTIESLIKDRKLVQIADGVYAPIEKDGTVSTRVLDTRPDPEMTIMRGLAAAQTPQQRQAFFDAMTVDTPWGRQQWTGKKWEPVERPKEDDGASDTLFSNTTEALRNMPSDDYLKLIKEARAIAEAGAEEGAPVSSEAVMSALKTLVAPRLGPATFTIPGSGMGVQAPKTAEEATNILMKLRSGELDPNEPQNRWLVQQAIKLLKQ